MILAHIFCRSPTSEATSTSTTTLHSPTIATHMGPPIPDSPGSCPRLTAASLALVEAQAADSAV